MRGQRIKRRREFSLEISRKKRGGEERGEKYGGEIERGEEMDMRDMVSQKWAHEKESRGGQEKELRN